MGLVRFHLFVFERDKFIDMTAAHVSMICLCQHELQIKALFEGKGKYGPCQMLANLLNAI